MNDWLRRCVERENCDTEALSDLVDASGSPPDSDPFQPDSQVEVQYVSRGTYRLFNKTQYPSHMPFIYFKLPSDVSLLRNSGVYDATTVRDDNTLRADLVRLDTNTWVLHVNGELLRCPGLPSTILLQFHTHLLYSLYILLRYCMCMFEHYRRRDADSEHSSMQTTNCLMSS